MIELTDEQQAVCAHTTGPAAVTAVAGAGKTTAMVARIERLVREGTFAPERILAVSFSRAAVSDLRAALGREGACRAVRTATLHSLGLGVVRAAERAGLCEPWEEVGDHGERLLYRAMTRARNKPVTYQQELEALDPDDFLTYVGSEKADLAVPRTLYRELPEPLTATMRAAEPVANRRWYPSLFGFLERERRAQRILTFDDMMPEAWRLLTLHEPFRQRMQRRYDCIVVDEYQDVSRAQALVVDLLAEPHRNLMVVGDEDQTIYSWRGARAHFLRRFAEREGTPVYRLQDAFRSPAAPLVLANAVICRNRDRFDKRMHLVRGFEGMAKLHRPKSVGAQASNLAARIRSDIDEGRRPEEIAILVRLHAQTPAIEQALIDAEIPYHVTGEAPFYAQRDIATLIRYVSLALGAGSPGQLASWWFSIYNRPTRYLTRRLADAVATQLRAGRPLAETLEAIAGRSDERVAERVRELAGHLAWLEGAARSRPARKVLRDLERRLGYKQFLIDARPMTGEERALTIDGLIDYAEPFGSAEALLHHLRDLARAGHGRESAGAVTLTTIHRAKGREWESVHLPGCVEGRIPFSAADDAEALAEERRLFYVALTRSRSDLYLWAEADAELSRFVREAGGERRLIEVRELERLLERCTRRSAQAEELVQLGTLVHRTGLIRFLLRYWSPGHSGRERLLGELLALCQLASVGGNEAPDWAEDLAERLSPCVDPVTLSDELRDEVTRLLREREVAEVGALVRHHRFGAGRVEEVHGPDTLTVRFDAAGTKKLKRSIAGLVRLD